MRLSSPWLRWALLLLLGLLLAIGLARWPRQEAVSGAVSQSLQPALPQDSLIQVYFNHSAAAAYTEPYRGQTRLGDNLEQVILDAIAAAHSSIDVAVHELRLPQVALALQARQQAGVRVRVIVENEYSRAWSSLSAAEVAQLDDRARSKYEEFVQLADQDQDGQVTPAEARQVDAIAIFHSSGIPVIDDTADGSRGSSLMHHKFMVVDNQLLIVSSANWTMSDTHGDLLQPESTGNANHLLKINSPVLAARFSQEFSLMWGDGPGGQPSQFGLHKPYRPPVSARVGSSLVTVQFSPTSTRQPWQQSVNGLIGRSLNAAARSIDLALFVFSEQNVSNILEARHLQGVQVRSLVDPGFAYRNYSEILDMLGVTLPDSQCRIEASNHPWRNPIATAGIPALAPGDILHHKFGLIDGRTIVTGSQNWSDAANHSNDENLLVITNPKIAAHFQREFDRLFQTASLGIPDWLQAKIQRCR